MIHWQKQGDVQTRTLLLLLLWACLSKLLLARTKSQLRFPTMSWPASHRRDDADAVTDDDDDGNENKPPVSCTVEGGMLYMKVFVHADTVRPADLLIECSTIKFTLYIEFRWKSNLKSSASVFRLRFYDSTTSADSCSMFDWARQRQRQRIRGEECGSEYKFNLAFR